MSGVRTGGIHQMLRGKDRKARKPRACKHCLELKYSHYVALGCDGPCVANTGKFSSSRWRTISRHRMRYKAPITSRLPSKTSTRSGRVVSRTNGCSGKKVKRNRRVAFLTALGNTGSTIAVKVFEKPERTQALEIPDGARHDHFEQVF